MFLLPLILTFSFASDSEIPVWPKGAKVLSAGIVPRDPKTDVSIPTYTIYTPKKNTSGAAIIVFP